MFKRVTVTERGPNTARLDAEVRFMGMTMKRTERHVLTPPEKIEVDGSVRDAINTTVWTLQTVPEGTILTAELEVQFKGLLKLLQPVAEWQMRAVLPEWIVHSQDTWRRSSPNQASSAYLSRPCVWRTWPASNR
jgi:hypothetical protein